MESRWWVFSEISENKVFICKCNRVCKRAALEWSSYIICVWRFCMQTKYKHTSSPGPSSFYKVILFFLPDIKSNFYNCIPCKIEVPWGHWLTQRLKLKQTKIWKTRWKITFFIIIVLIATERISLATELQKFLMLKARVCYIQIVKNKKYIIYIMLPCLIQIQKSVSMKIETYLKTKEWWYTITELLIRIRQRKS